MRVLSINNNRHNVYKNNNFKYKDIAISNQIQNNMSFQGNYLEVYNRVKNSSVANLSDCYSMFRNLLNAAKTEIAKGARYNYIFDLEPESLIQKADKEYRCYQDDHILISSPKYPSPILTVEDGVVSFHDPEYGEFGRGNINFWQDGKSICLSREEDFHSFWLNGRKKEYYKNVDGGGIIDHVYYDEDGTKPFWKNFFTQ